MRAYFSKRPPCAPADPAPVFQCVPYMRQSASERVGGGVGGALESSRSRLWLNSLFGESHVPGDVARPPSSSSSRSLSPPPQFFAKSEILLSKLRRPQVLFCWCTMYFFFRFPDLKSLGRDSIARRSIFFNFFFKVLRKFTFLTLGCDRVKSGSVFRQRPKKKQPMEFLVYCTPPLWTYSPKSLQKIQPIHTSPSEKIGSVTVYGSLIWALHFFYLSIFWGVIYWIPLYLFDACIF